MVSTGQLYYRYHCLVNRSPGIVYNFQLDSDSFYFHLIVKKKIVNLDWKTFKESSQRLKTNRNFSSITKYFNRYRIFVSQIGIQTHDIRINFLTLNFLTHRLLSKAPYHCTTTKSYCTLINCSLSIRFKCNDYIVLYTTCTRLPNLTDHVESYQHKFLSANFEG